MAKQIILDSCCGCLASVLLSVMVYCCVNIDELGIILSYWRSYFGSCPFWLSVHFLQSRYDEY